MLHYWRAQGALWPEDYGEVSLSEVSIKQVEIYVFFPLIEPIFGNISSYTSRFEIEIEPIFGILALYDIKEKKKVYIFSSLDDLHSCNAELMPH